MKKINAKIKSLDIKEKKLYYKYIKVISKIIKNIGYTTIAKQILGMRAKEIEKNVNWVIDKTIKVGKGCEYLTNPITRVRTKNPRRPLFLKAKVMLKKAILVLKRLEKNIK